MAGNRATIRIDLDVSDMADLGNVCQRRGTTQIFVVSRLVKWLSQQDDATQEQILKLSKDRNGRQLIKQILHDLQSAVDRRPSKTHSRKANNGW